MAGTNTLVGRDDECVRLVAVLGIRPDRPPTGDVANAVLLAGDAGVGKTRLLGEVRDIARDAGWAVLVGHCLDFGSSALPYLPFSEVMGRLTAEQPELVDRLVESHPAVGRLQPGRRVMSGANESGDDSRANLDRQELFEAVHALLELSAEQAPTLLIIEDAHWADQSTREMLSFLFSRPFRATAGIVISYRSDDLHRRHPLRAQVAAWARVPGVERLHLDPLPSAAIQEIIHQIHPAPLSAADLARIVERAEGNPFFAEELVQAVETPQRWLPSDLADVLLIRLDQLDETTRQVLRAASVAGRRVSHSQLAAASGVAESALDEALRQATEMNVLVPQETTYAFRHALLSEAVYDDLLPGERIRLHARYADALREGRAQGTAAELARHARLAMDNQTALDASIRAGREAMAVGGPDEAAQHLEQALELLADPRQDPGDLDLAALVAETADALIASGQPIRAEAMIADQLSRLPEDAPPQWRPRLLAARATAMIMTEPEEDPVAVSAEAVRLLPADAAALRARVLAAHARVLSMYQRNPEAEAAALEALDLAERLNLRVIASEVTTTLSGLKKAGPVDVLRSSLREAIERAEASGAVQAELRGRFLLGRSYEDRADWDEAERWYHSVVAKGQATNLVWAPYVSDARWQLGWIGYVRGCWDDVLQLTDVTDQSPPPIAGRLLELLRMSVEFARGAEVKGLDAMRSLWAVDGLIGIYAAGLTIEQAGRIGDPAAAVAAYDDVVAVLSRIWQPNFGARLRLATLAVQAIADSLTATPTSDHRALVESAQRLHQDGHTVVTDPEDSSGYWGPEGQAWLRRLDAELLRARWLAGIDTPDVTQLVDSWRTTAAAFDAIGYRYQSAVTHATLAEVLTASGDLGGTEEHKAIALDIATELGATPLLSPLAGRGVSPQRVRGEGWTGELTPREAEIIQLVALGRSNAEIGRQLFISGKTVSVHVSNILAKLGAASRTEAAAIARRRGLLTG